MCAVHEDLQAFYVWKGLDNESAGKLGYLESPYCQDNSDVMSLIPFAKVKGSNAGKLPTIIMLDIHFIICFIHF
jgi:hypothetical protein